MNQASTLTQHLLRRHSDHPDQRDLVLILNDLATIGKFISRETNRAGLVGILGAAGLTNVQDEEVQKLDVVANETCKNFLRQTGHFAALASEEEDGVVSMGEYGENAKYVISFDPLDGSSNIDVNVSIGTIFSVHKLLPGVDRTDEKHFLQPGRDQVLAGYILYGSSTVLVFSFGNGVHEFTLDQGFGEFLLSRENICLPKECSYYSVNEGNTQYFTDKDKKFIANLRDEEKISARYIGSGVADIHRNLLKGGIFMYPAVDKKGAGEFKGKYRLNFEAKPFAFLFEHAAGLSTNGEKSILDIVPTSIHERTAVVLGNKDIVEKYLKFN